MLQKDVVVGYIKQNVSAFRKHNKYLFSHKKATLDGSLMLEYFIFRTKYPSKLTIFLFIFFF